MAFPNYAPLDFMLRRQPVHILIVWVLPSFVTLTFLILGRQKRFARLETWLLVWLMRWPAMMPLSQMEHFAIYSAPPVFYE
jgi:hypothetical protein